MITLRPYQTEGIAQIRAAYSAGFKAPLYVLPCGGGKTRMFSHMAESSERRGKRVLILVHRVELVDQVVESLKDCDVTPDIIAGGYARKQIHRPVAVASVQTLVRRLDSYPAPTLIVVDECHHAAASTWSTILRKYDKAKLLGVTASPIRADGHGLSTHFDKLIVGPGVTELTAAGFLSPYRLFAPPTVDTSGLHIRAGDFKTEEAEALMDKPAVTGDAFSHYRKHADGLPALVFCTSVKHAHNVAELFRSKGVSAYAIDGGTDRDIRRMAVRDFREGKIKVLSQCSIANEGFDVPGVHCGIFLRPTSSLGLWIQMTGRCSRIAPGKSHAILLDHVNNARTLGLPDEPREWTLTGDTERRKKKAAPGVRVCPKCFAASRARALVCVECGAPFAVKPRGDIAEKEGELVELTAEEIAKKRERREQGRSQSLAQLEEFAAKKGYAKGWATHIWQAREAKKQRRA
jgi:DNA repair protein RadD